MLGKQQWKRVDVALLVLLPIAAVIVSLLTNASYLGSLVLFYGLPAAYFSYRTPHMVKKTGVFSLSLSVPLVIVLDYVMTRSHAWFIPHSPFPYRLFGVVPLDDFAWGFLLMYSVLIVYEHFLDKGKHELVDKHMKYVLWPVYIVSVLVVLMIFVSPKYLQIPHAYFWTGLVFIALPIITSLAAFPRLFSKYIKIGVYFFLVGISYELTALELGQWEFPGVAHAQYFGWVTIGNHGFPLEELVFWIGLLSVAIVSYYEFFDDDRK